MSKPKTATPVIEWLPASSLTVEDGFNVREPKRMTANIKELSALITAHGFIDPSIHVVQYVERDGKKIVRGGHTLIEAAKSLGMKEVPAVKTTMDATQELVNLVTSNAAHPLNQYEQGEVYVRLRDGTDAEKAPKGVEIRDAMTVKAIADIVGYSAQHVANCVAIRESSPEIREMLLNGEVSANAVTLAQKNSTSDAVTHKVLVAAAKAAKADGKETGTEKHVKAVKDEIVPPKKLKAAAPEKPATPPPKSLDAIGATGSSEPDADESEQVTKPSISAPAQTQEEMTLPKGDRKSGIACIISKVVDQRNLGLDDDDIDAIAEALSEVPF